MSGANAGRAAAGAAGIVSPFVLAQIFTRPCLPDTSSVVSAPKPPPCPADISHGVTGGARREEAERPAAATAA